MTTKYTRVTETPSLSRLYQVRPSGHLQPGLLGYPSILYTRPPPQMVYRIRPKMQTAQLLCIFWVDRTEDWPYIQPPGPALTVKPQIQSDQRAVLKALSETLKNWKKRAQQIQINLFLIKELIFFQSYIKQ